MANYTTSIRSPKAPADVFEYMSDLSKFDEWDPGTVSAVQVKGDRPRLGAAYDLKVKVPVRDVTMRYEVIEFDSPNRIVAKGTVLGLTSIDTIVVEADGTGSILTYDAELTLSGPLRVFDPILNKGFQSTGDKAAEGIVRVLDGTKL